VWYLFEVYALVVLLVVLLFLAFHLLVAISRLVLAATRFMIRSLRNVPAIRTGFGKQHWGMNHR
jgi:hypothetical protein